MWSQKLPCHVHSVSRPCQHHCLDEASPLHLDFDLDGKRVYQVLEYPDIAWRHHDLIDSYTRRVPEASQDMDARLKPIPAFYCCYLLRSTVRTSSVYVGSSPHPSRRLAQHNGKVKGGAARTSRLSLRPWEMVCVVAGFPSNIAALQFEWAWQNAHLTRHIDQEQRISFPVTRVKTNSKTGKTRRKPGRPQTSTTDKLANLHLLLRTPYFSKWPLELKFFNQETHQLWTSWCQRTDGQIRDGIEVLLDLPQDLLEDKGLSSTQRHPKRSKTLLIGKGGVDGIDPTYSRYRDVLEKSKGISDATATQSCSVCSNRIDIRNDLFTVCPEDHCQSIAHITCLSNRFLKDSQSELVVPEGGFCPSCQSFAKWMDLMREVTLRTRGEEHVRKLLKKRLKGTIAMAADMLENSDDKEAGDSMDEAEDIDVAYDIDELDDDMSVTSVDSLDSLQQPSQKVSSKHAQQRLEIVIEDSEDER